MVHWDSENEPVPGVKNFTIQLRHIIHGDWFILLSSVVKIALCGLANISIWPKRRILRLLVVNFSAEHKNCFWHEQLKKIMLDKISLARQYHAKNSMFSRMIVSANYELKYTIKKLISTIESAKQCGLCFLKITTNQAWSLFAWMIAWSYSSTGTWPSCPSSLLVNYFGDVEYFFTSYLASTSAKSVGGDCFLVQHHPKDNFTNEQPGKNVPTFNLDSYSHHLCFFHWYFYYCCWFVIFQILSAITITKSVGGDCLVLPHHPTDLLMRLYPRVDMKSSPSKNAIVTFP